MRTSWPAQLLAILRLETKKTFFSRRGLWVYLLAAAPVILLLGHSIEAPLEQQRMVRLQAGHPVSLDALRSIRRGMTVDQVVGVLGQPYSQRSFVRRMGEHDRVERRFYRYTDGRSEYSFAFDDGRVARIRHEDPETLPEDNLMFAAMFQYFDLRLAIFFGCVGIFTNLFRGEMVDKSLHYYLLTPMPRELLVAGKFLAGLIATVTIFTISTALQVPAMLLQFGRPEVAGYLQGGGWEHFAAYLGVTIIACVGYGSVFLATGLIFRNPIVPAAVVLVWESVNLFLPAGLKMVSLTYYLQSLCPVVAPPDASMPQALRTLISATEPATRLAALNGIGVMTIVLLVVAALRGRRLEINYSAE